MPLDIPEALFSWSVGELARITIEKVVNKVLLINKEGKKKKAAVHMPWQRFAMS